MIKVNEYFGGKVKSLALSTSSGNATVGVIVPGEYEFGTSQKEIMHLTSGSMDALLPGSSDWKTFNAGQKFEIAPNQKFKVRMAKDVAYLCEYF